MPAASTGAAMEAAAGAYLAGQGLQLLERNYRCRLGELDLIMRDRQTLVFVEVRCRRSAGRSRQHGFGRGEDTVTRTKQRKLLQAARHWLMLRADHRRPEPTCRFDVVAVDEVAGEPVFTWHRNAFGA